MKIDIWAEAAKEAASRAAGGRGSTALPPQIEEAVAEASRMLEYRGSCPLCGRRLDTRRGYYLHLTRVHLEEISSLIRSLSRGLAEGRREGLI